MKSIALATILLIVITTTARAAGTLGDLASPAPAKTNLLATCSEPKGPRLDYGGPSQEDWKLEKSQDGYKGVNPVFIVDDGNPGKMSIIWGNTKLYDEFVSDWVKELASPEAQEASIMLNTETQISAVLVAPKGANIYTLYPTTGFGYFTFHSNQSFLGEFVTGMTLYADCKFLP